MLINTTRFGQLNIERDEIIYFDEGLLGFSELRLFVLLDDPSDEIFAWLQSCETPDIAFPILEPELFSEAAKFKLSKKDLDFLEIGADQKPRFFSIVTIPDEPKEMTANLKAPIVINILNRKAKQCVLQDNSLAIREPIFAKLQERVVSSTSDQEKIKDGVIDSGVAIKLPNPPEAGL